jgi:LCP family protein required for cell wall assembly
MTLDRTEQLVRDVFTEEAGRAVDSREVLAAVRGRRPRRSYGLVLATAAVVVVVAAVAAFVVPEVFRRSSVPPATSRVATPVNVLVIGTDVGGLTDTIVLVQVTGNGSVSLVSLPRDTWVSAPGGMTRLNGIYSESGADGLVATVRDLTGVTVDQYAVVDMAAVGALATAAGGVQVCLKAATSDVTSGADFAAGQQTVSGDAALAFVRQRRGLPNGDFDRMVRQQVFLRSLATQLRDAPLQAVFDAVKDRVQHSDGFDLLGFAATLVEAKTLHVGTIPIANPDYQAPGGGSVVAVDPAAVKRFVTGLPGTPPATGDVPCVD